MLIRPLPTLDQELCAGDGLRAGIAPNVLIMLDDGLAYGTEGERVASFAEAA